MREPEGLKSLIYTNWFVVLLCNHFTILPEVMPPEIAKVVLETNFYLRVRKIHKFHKNVEWNSPWSYPLMSPVLVGLLALTQFAQISHCETDITSKWTDKGWFTETAGLLGYCLGCWPYIQCPKSMTRTVSHPKVVKILNGGILMLLFGHTYGKRVEHYYIIIILLFFTFHKYYYIRSIPFNIMLKSNISMCNWNQMTYLVALIQSFALQPSEEIRNLCL